MIKHFFYEMNFMYMTWPLFLDWGSREVEKVDERWNSLKMFPADIKLTLQIHNLWHNSCVEVAVAVAKIRNRENMKAWFLSRSAAAAVAWNFLTTLWSSKTFHNGAKQIIRISMRSIFATTAATAVSLPHCNHSASALHIRNHTLKTGEALKKNDHNLFKIILLQSLWAVNGNDLQEKNIYIYIYISAGMKPPTDTNSVPVTWTSSCTWNPCCQWLVTVGVLSGALSSFENSPF